ncbi:trans-2-enoyl-CoA reductase [Gemmatimonadetes bacterium T265]|nr:trans-2-enoyl-CoA reductase [Gemmatimonadetes bacterium T265]
MHVVRFDRFGDPAEVLAVVDAPDPGPPAAGAVAVDFVASPLNPSDLLTVRGEYGVRPDLPATPGYEGVGRVAALGDGVAHLAAGDLVLLIGGRGTWRARANLKAARLFPLPPADPLQLAMLTANPPTALLMLEQFVALEPGQWVIQNAANSGVGVALIAIARARGLRTVNVVRRASLAPQLAEAGADVVLVDGPDLAKRVRAALGGAGAEPGALRLGVDAVGGHATARLARAVAEGGTVVSYGSLSGEPCAVEARDTIFRDVTLRGFWLTRWIGRAGPADVSRVFGTVARYVADGTVRVPVGATYPLARAREAAAHAAREGRDGKVLLVAD